MRLITSSRFSSTSSAVAQIFYNNSPFKLYFIRLATAYVFVQNVGLFPRIHSHLYTRLAD